MNLKQYFESAMGTGVLSTADIEGRVNSAIYSRPHMMDDGSLAIIMMDRLSYNNLKSNPYAVYLFREKVEGYKGLRIYLRKVREEKDIDLIEKLRRRSTSYEGTKYLVYFKIEKQLPLIGE